MEIDKENDEKWSFDRDKKPRRLQKQLQLHLILSIQEKTSRKKKVDRVQKFAKLKMYLALFYAYLMN